MSLNSLATTCVARELSARVTGRNVPPASDDAVGPKDQDVQNALSALVEYVPAETITLYLATLASLPALVPKIPGLSALLVYAFFGVLTPIMFALIYAGKRRAAGQVRSPERSRNWPWWPMIAATIAFLAWGLSVPNGPMSNDGGNVLGALIAIFVSTFLGVLGRFFAPVQETPKAETH